MKVKGFAQLSKILSITLLLYIFTSFTVSLSGVSPDNSNKEEMTMLLNGNDVFMEISNIKVYAMLVNEEEVGLIISEEYGHEIYNNIIEEITEEYGEVYIEGDVFFNELMIDYNEALSKETELYKAIRNNLIVKAYGFGIIIDEKVTCYVESNEDAEEVIKLIISMYNSPIESNVNSELYEETKIKETIEFKRMLASVEEIVDINKAVDMITLGSNIRNYTIEDGDSVWTIAHLYNLSIPEIKLLNPEINIDFIKPGQQIKLATPSSCITVITIEKATYIESIDYSTEKRKDNTLEQGKIKVIQDGQKGEKQIQKLITKNNGVITTSELLNDKITKEPIKKIIAEGTKPTPSRAPISRNGVEMTPWYGNAENIFSRGTIAKVTHVDTGLTFFVKRYQGTSHADTEPLTAEDTSILRQIYGGKLSWDRKAIVVEVNGKKMAASMNGMPHGSSSIFANNYPGHFCIHFYGSKIHGSNRSCPDHQAMIRKAAGY